MLLRIRIKMHAPRLRPRKQIIPARARLDVCMHACVAVRMFYASNYLCCHERFCPFANHFGCCRRISRRSLRTVNRTPQDSASQLHWWRNSGWLACCGECCLRSLSASTYLLCAVCRLRDGLKKFTNIDVKLAQRDKAWSSAVVLFVLLCLPPAARFMPTKTAYARRVRAWIRRECFAGMVALWSFCWNWHHNFFLVFFSSGPLA